MKQKLYFTEFQSPIGKLAIYATDKGLCYLEFEDHVHNRKYLRTIEKDAEIIQKQISI